MDTETRVTGNATATDGTTATDNKTLVAQALGKLIGTGDVATLAPLMSEDFVHHRPDGTSSTKAEWLAAVRAALVPLADMRVEVQHVLGDGDHVVMHTRRRLPEGPEIVVVDILRVEDGLIAEVWEIIEPVAQAAANLVWWEPAGQRP